MPLGEVKAYRRRKKKAPEMGGGNGIDALPDEALQHVLSFLPSREAVQTCVLARRWRHLWRSVPALRIQAGQCYYETLTEQDFNSLTNFVNNLLLLRDCSAPLDLCEFHIEELDNSEDKPQFSFWIQQVLLCKAQVIRLEYYDTNNDTLILDNQPLISQHLTTLELTFVTLRGKSLNFSSCLVLKNLLLDSCCIDAKKLLAPSIEKLSMSYCMFGFHQGRYIRTWISAPRLVCLDLTNNYDLIPLLEAMPSLVKAFVRIRHHCMNHSNCGEVTRHCLLLEGLSKAESLELVTKSALFIFKRDLMWRPTFSKLKTVLLNEWCVETDFHLLICFLQLTPVLEKLTLQLCEAPDNWVLPGGFNVLLEAPIASKKLKLIEIKCKKFDERVHQISRILSIYNIYLEQINIQLTQRCSDRKLATGAILFALMPCMDKSKEWRNTQVKSNGEKTTSFQAS